MYVFFVLAQPMDYMKLVKDHPLLIVRDEWTTYIVNPRIKELDAFLAIFYMAIYHGNKESVSYLVGPRFSVVISLPSRRYLKELGVKEEWLRIYFNNLDELLNKGGEWITISGDREDSIDLMFKYIPKEVLLGGITGWRYVEIGDADVSENPEAYDLVANKAVKLRALLKKTQIDLRHGEPDWLVKYGILRKFRFVFLIPDKFSSPHEFVPLKVGSGYEVELLADYDFFPPDLQIFVTWDEHRGWEIFQINYGIFAKD